MSGVATAIVGSAIIGGVSSNMAANKQSHAAEQAAGQQMQQYQQARSDLAPYRTLGQSEISPLMQAINAPALNGKFNFDASNLEQTPGYQFTLNQGLKGVNASAAAKGLGVSGADIRGAANYTTGLADQTYGNQFSRALQSYMTNYNNAANNASRLAGIVQLGQNSAATTANQGLTAAQNAGNFSTSGAAAGAAGMVGAGNAFTGAINTGLNYDLQKQMIAHAFNNSSGSGSSPSLPAYQPANYGWSQ